ncbi:7396_t:CDS:2, partial [Dentiscutata heterogama]
MSEVFRGLRPSIPKYIPKLIIELINNCWHARPEKRLTSKEIYDNINIFIDDISNNKSTEFVMQIKEADEILQKFLESGSSNDIEMHPNAIYSSRRHIPLSNKNVTDQDCHIDSQFDHKNDVNLLISQVGAIKVENDEHFHKHDKMNYDINYEQDSEGLLIPKANVIEVENNEIYQKLADETNF